MKRKTDKELSVREALDYLGRNGCMRHEVYFRSLLSTNKIKSHKNKTARIILESDLVAYIKGNKNAGI